MQSLVVYDPLFGNTVQLAQAIGGMLGERGSVGFATVREGAPPELAGIDLLVVGSPTIFRRETRAMRELIASIPAGGLAGIRVAAFDTRPRAARWRSGSAARHVAGRVKSLGGTLVIPAESFFVAGSRRRLEAQEIERAMVWARRVLDQAEAYHPRWWSSRKELMAGC